MIHQPEKNCSIQMADKVRSSEEGDHSTAVKHSNDEWCFSFSFIYQAKYVCLLGIESCRGPSLSPPLHTLTSTPATMEATVFLRSPQSMHSHSGQRKLSRKPAMAAYPTSCLSSFTYWHLSGPHGLQAPTCWPKHTCEEHVASHVDLKHHLLLKRIPF